MNSKKGVTPVALGIMVDPPTLIFTYDAHLHPEGTRKKKRRRRKIPLRQFTDRSDVNKVYYAMTQRHDMVGSIPKISVIKMIRVIQEVMKGLEIKEAVEKVDKEYTLDPNKDLNKVSPEELQRAKEIMDEEFARNVIRPGDPGWERDKVEVFDGPKLRSTWDDDSDQEDENEDDKNKEGAINSSHQLLPKKITDDDDKKEADKDDDNEESIIKEQEGPTDLQQDRVNEKVENEIDNRNQTDEEEDNYEVEEDVQSEHYDEGRLLEKKEDKEESDSDEDDSTNNSLEEKVHELVSDIRDFEFFWKDKGKVKDDDVGKESEHEDEEINNYQVNNGLLPQESEGHAHDGESMKKDDDDKEGLEDVEEPLDENQLLSICDEIESFRDEENLLSFHGFDDIQLPFGNEENDKRFSNLAKYEYHDDNDNDDNQVSEEAKDEPECTRREAYLCGDDNEDEAEKEEEEMRNRSYVVIDIGNSILSENSFLHQTEAKKDKGEVGEIETFSSIEDMVKDKEKMKERNKKEPPTFMWEGGDTDLPPIFTSGFGESREKSKPEENENDVAGLEAEEAVKEVKSQSSSTEVVIKPGLTDVHVPRNSTDGKLPTPPPPTQKHPQENYEEDDDDFWNL